MARCFQAVAMLALSFGSVSAAAQEPKLSDVVARVHAYVAAYGAELAAVVAEETYTQAVEGGDRAAGTDLTKSRAGGTAAYGGSDRSLPTANRLANTRVLRSDYALTKIGERGAWIGFRDTFEVDGLVFRDRDRVQRLHNLLASGEVAEAARIAEQNARFNLAEELLTRNINVPTLALELLHPTNRERFSASRAGLETVNGQRAWVIEFRERGKPTIVRTPDGRDQPSRVVAVIDPLTGTVLKTTLSWEKLTGSIVVTYGLVPRIPALVPLTMSERYTTRGGSHITGEATYTNYRQFQTSARVIQ